MSVTKSLFYVTAIRNCDQAKPNICLTKLRGSNPLFYFTAMPVFQSLDVTVGSCCMLLAFVGAKRVEGLFSDICVLATVNAKESPCFSSEEENCDKKVESIAENTAYVLLSSLLNSIILMSVLSDMVRHLTSD